MGQLVIRYKGQNNPENREFRFTIEIGGSEKRDIAGYEVQELILDGEIYTRKDYSPSSKEE